MVMRVSEGMKFNAITQNLAASQREYTILMEKSASQKEINRPSDDPIGMSQVLGFRSSRASIAQHQKNIGSCKSWLTMTESQLSSVNDLLVRAREISIAQATATASGETRDIAAMEVQQMIEQMQSLANAQYNGRYIFAGTQTNEAPFDDFYSYTGNDKKLSVQIGKDVNFEYSISGASAFTDQGDEAVDIFKTLTDLKTALESVATRSFDGTVASVGNIVTFSESDDYDLFVVGSTLIANGDTVTIVALGPGSNQVTVDVAPDPEWPDPTTITSLNDEFTVISGQLDNLQSGADQINQNIAECGSRMNRLEVAQNTLVDLDLNLTEMISNTEDVDFTELITQLTMKETALRASYSMASKIGNLTILDFLR